MPSQRQLLARKRRRGWCETLDGGGLPSRSAPWHSAIRFVRHLALEHGADHRGQAALQAQARGPDAGSLRAYRLLLGHRKLASTVRHLDRTFRQVQ